MHPESVAELTEALLRVLASPNICSRQWIYDQYDHQVMVNTVVLPGGDAAVLRIGDTGRGEMTDRGIAVSSDCNGRYCYLDPYVGAQIALAEAARNVACVGGEPAAITDCLNFGSPEKPEVFWTFHEAIRGMSDACKEWDIPVISGNVSFYNESLRPADLPHAHGRARRARSTTSTTTRPWRSSSKATSSCSWARPSTSWAAASTSASCTGPSPAGRRHSTSSWSVTSSPRCATGIRAGLVKSAHDCSEGGIGVTLAECCVAGGIGADVHLGDELPAGLGAVQRDAEPHRGYGRRDRCRSIHRHPRRAPGALWRGRYGRRRHARHPGQGGCAVDMLREAHAHTLERLVGGQWQPEELREG